MQQFTVPQFIDVESKIIGPITTRQFLIFLAASIVIAISYKIFDFALFLTVGIAVLVIAGLFAFFKVNGQLFHLFVLNVIQTSRRPRLRVWNNKLNPLQLETIVNFTYQEKSRTKDFYRQSRLAELSLVVDTSGQYRGAFDDSEIIISEE